MSLLKIARRIRAQVTKLEKQAGWENLPKGWTKESAEKFYNSLSGEAKHKVTQCIKKMKGKMSNPGAFCASLKDLIEGTTDWREGRK